ncbi:YTH domain-containing protein 1-like [Schistocerca americana]|uniref:YTH domain-containing protein 1-like n=1 Tax=Schistocerca americana TaxID=7009 RepID=UPI001F502008|nr:YTH domain-containing protein 1-like [Schistocerca americana]
MKAACAPILNQVTKLETDVSELKTSHDEVKTNVETSTSAVTNIKLNNKKILDKQLESLRKQLNKGISNWIADKESEIDSKINVAVNNAVQQMCSSAEANYDEVRDVHSNKKDKENPMWKQEINLERVMSSDTRLENNFPSHCENLIIDITPTYGNEKDNESLLNDSNEEWNVDEDDGESEWSGSIDDDEKDDEEEDEEGNEDNEEENEENVIEENEDDGGGDLNDGTGAKNGGPRGGGEWTDITGNGELPNDIDFVPEREKNF